MATVATALLLLLLLASLADVALGWQGCGCALLACEVLWMMAQGSVRQPWEWLYSRMDVRGLWAGGQALQHGARCCVSQGSACGSCGPSWVLAGSLSGQGCWKQCILL